MDEHHGIGIQNNQVYSTTGPLRTTSSSNSPGNLHGQQSSTLLVVPQPINATKISTGLSNNTGRKYQCKMCPQVSVRFFKNCELNINFFWGIIKII